MGDMGNNVIVINAEKMTGKKYWNKFYFSHTQNKRSGARRIGGYRIEYFKDLQKRLPECIIKKAVFGMLPKRRLGRSIRAKHLKVFKSGQHPHTSNCPQDITNLISHSIIQKH